MNIFSDLTPSRELSDGKTFGQGWIITELINKICKAIRPHWIFNKSTILHVAHQTGSWMMAKFLGKTLVVMWSSQIITGPYGLFCCIGEKGVLGFCLYLKNKVGV